MKIIGTIPEGMPEIVLMDFFHAVCIERFAKDKKVVLEWEWDEDGWDIHFDIPDGGWLCTNADGVDEYCNAPHTLGSFTMESPIRKTLERVAFWCLFSDIDSFRIECER